MRSTFRRHPFLAGAFSLALLIMLVFAASFAWRLAYWQMHAEVQVQPWMTIGYVGHSWGLKPTLIDETAQLPLPVNGHPYTLQEIADQRGVPVSSVIADVEAAVAKLKAEQGNSGP